MEIKTIVKKAIILHLNQSINQNVLHFRAAKEKKIYIGFSLSWNFKSLMCRTYFIYSSLYHRYLENNENVYRKKSTKSNKIKQADDIYHCMKRLCDETQ